MSDAVKVLKYGLRLYSFMPAFSQGNVDLHLLAIPS